MEPQMPTKVYLAISQVGERLSKAGISKDRKNAQQGYSFRGIDDVYNALAPFLAEAKLCILPNVLARECVERQTKTGGALFYVTVKVRFDFVSAEDCSSHAVVTYGEAMDSADKATNKAMSAAYKYAAMQAFCIPTEGDNDADATTQPAIAPSRVGLPSGPITPSTGVKESLTPEEINLADHVVSAMVDWLAESQITDAVLTMENSGLTNEQKIYAWGKFDSKTRTALKAEHTRIRKEAAAKLAPQQA